MNKYRPIPGMEVPRFADIASFFRLPIVKDSSEVDIGIIGVPWDAGTTTCTLTTDINVSNNNEGIL